MAHQITCPHSRSITLSLQSWIALIVFTLFGASGLVRANVCELWLTQFSDNPIAFWKQSDPIMVFRDGTHSAYLTFSHDTEMPWHDVLSILRKDPVAYQKFLGFFYKGENNSIFQITLNRVRSIWNYSDKQVEKFLLRKGVTLKDAPFVLSDFNPSPFAYLFEFKQRDDISEFLLDLTVQVLRNRGHKINGHLDERIVEINHSSSEDTPNGFREVVRKLERDIGHPQPHFHIGLPSDFVTSAQALAIARALEAKVTLGLAQQFKEPENFKTEFARAPFRTGSPLANKYGRGSIYLQLSDTGSNFTKPFVAHDLEIRQMDSFSHGLELMELAINLTKKRERLKIFDRREFGGTTRDVTTGNILGALEFISLLFRESDRPHLYELSAKLKELANETKHDFSKGYELSGKTRAKIFHFLVRHQISDLLGEDLFLTSP